MRVAKLKDISYVANCLIAMSSYLKSQVSNIYTQHLPDKLDDSTLSLSKDFIKRKDAITFIHEIDNKPVGCICVMIRDASFIPMGIGKVGYISLCWVEEKYRDQKIATLLLTEAKKWLTSKNIKTMELSYLSQNMLAKTAWSKLGFEEFWSFAYKQL